MARKPLEIQVSMILKEYDEEVVKATNKAIMTVSRKAVQQLKATSPRKTGEYASSWATRKGETSLHGIEGRVIYNKKGQLTHLLEKGHIIKNKYGIQKRRNGSGNETDAHKHIKPVEEWVKDALPKEVEKRL